MSKSDQQSQILFPIQEDLPNSEVLYVRDLDVVGVGGVRRHQLEKLIQEGRRFVMWTHEPLIPEDLRLIYNEEILRTLKWLRPINVEAGPVLDLQEVMKEVFQRNFVRTNEFMGVMALRLQNDYLQEMTWSSWLLQDHLRYLPGFVRSKFPQNKELQEIVHWEWVNAWLEVQAFHYEGLSDPGVLAISPSFQTVHLSKDSAVLGRDEGLYAFVFSSKRKQVVEKKLDLFDAQIIDLLQEDRKFSHKQLLEMLVATSEVKPMPSKNEWQEKFLELLDADIILEMPPLKQGDLG